MRRAWIALALVACAHAPETTEDSEAALAREQPASVLAVWDELVRA